MGLTYQQVTSFGKFWDLEFFRQGNFQKRKVGRISCVVFDVDRLSDPWIGSDHEWGLDRVDLQTQIECANVVRAALYVKKIKYKHFLISIACLNLLQM